MSINLLTTFNQRVSDVISTLNRIESFCPLEDVIHSQSTPNITNKAARNACSLYCYGLDVTPNVPASQIEPPHVDGDPLGRGSPGIDSTGPPRVDSTGPPRVDGTPSSTSNGQPSATSSRGLPGIISTGPCVDGVASSSTNNTDSGAPGVSGASASSADGVQPEPLSADRPTTSEGKT